MNLPLQLAFKTVALSPQITVTDAAGGVVLYVKQKAFKLKEAITVFADAEQTRPLYRMAADRVLDISARYQIDDADGRALGALQRRGMRSIWRAHYEVIRDGQTIMTIREENPWVKVMDALVGEIPIVGLFTGYMLHPTYAITRAEAGAAFMRLKKQPAFFEGRYAIESLAEVDAQDEELAVLSLLMMILLERFRG